MERSVDGMNLHIGRNTPEILFRITCRNCSKDVKNSLPIPLKPGVLTHYCTLCKHVQNQCFTKFSIIWRPMPSLTGAANYQQYLIYIYTVN
jgi:hypothetical protein